MNTALIKWLNRNAEGCEFFVSAEGDRIIIIPNKPEEGVDAMVAARRISKYYKDARVEWRGNCEWLAVFL